MLIRKLGEIGSALYRTIIFPFVRIGIEIRTKSVLKQGTYVNKGTILRGRNFIGKGSTLTNTDMGFGSYISVNGDLSNAKVGKYCSIGPNLCSVGGNHPVSTYVSTHPAFYAKNNGAGFSYVENNSYDEDKFTDKSKGYFYEIGNDVWIGANVSICQGVRIGDGAVIGAGSLVNRDVEPYAVYAGIPAKKIRMRFDDDQINRLTEYKWWDNDEKFIKEHAADFADVNEFINKYC